MERPDAPRTPAPAPARGESRTLGVLLAGGRGARLGAGVPKALVPCAGRTLLERARERLAALCDRVVVVAPAGMVLPVEPSVRVGDRPGARGPLAAMLAGLSARPFGEALVLAVDLPLVSVEALGRLRALRGDAAAIVPRPSLVLHRREGAEADAGRDTPAGEDPGAADVVASPARALAQPLAAWYSAGAVPVLEEAYREGVRSVNEAVARLAPRFVEDRDLVRWPGGREAWWNVNTRDELEWAEARLLRESAADAGAPRA